MPIWAVPGYFLGLGSIHIVLLFIYSIMQFLGVARQRQRLCNRLGQSLSSTKMSQILSSVS